MQLTIQLSPRQAARLLAQALHQRVQLEIEPRPELHEGLLWGTLEGREQDLLRVRLQENPSNASLHGLVGGICDVRMILSEQLCMFTTHVADVAEQTTPRQIRLAVPQTMQLANRRRFARMEPKRPVAVRLKLAGSVSPMIGVLTDIGPHGAACRFINRELDDLALIGDEAAIEFSLPWSKGPYELRVTFCNKKRVTEDGHLVVGFEFCGPDTHPDLARLRQALNEEAARLAGQGDLP